MQAANHQQAFWKIQSTCGIQLVPALERTGCLHSGLAVADSGQWIQHNDNDDDGNNKYR